MFGINWSSFVDAMVRTKVQQFFLIQGEITQDGSGPIKFIIDLIQDLMVTYILTKFGADWLVFVDARV